MDERPLAPGEVRFDATATPPEPPKQMSAKWVVGLFAAFALLIGYLSHKFPDGYPPKPASEMVQVPPAPAPPGSYAVFSELGAPGEGAAGEKQSAGFVHERLVILRVPPNDLPDTDRVAAANNGRNTADHVAKGRTPNDRPVTLASHFDSDTTAGIKRAFAERGGVLEAKTLPPYILHGDVDITCGDLINDDAGYAAVLLEDGNLSRASIYLADGKPRGPPVPVRKVYIVGNVHEVHGPEQYKKSVLVEKTLDLGPTDTSSEVYRQRLEDWNKEVVALEARLHVPAEDLRAYAGARIQVQNGEIVSAVDKDGIKVEEPSSIQMKRQTRELKRAMNHEGSPAEKLNEREVTHAIEHAVP